MNKILFVLIALLAIPAFADPAASDDVGGGTIYVDQQAPQAEPELDLSGWYGQLGLAVSWLPGWSLDEVTIQPLGEERRIPLDTLFADADPGVGFGMDARVGHRYGEDSIFGGDWLANEFQLQYVGPTELRIAGTEASTLRRLYFGWNARVFPLTTVEAVPKILQPYLLGGIGGKYFEVNGNNALGENEDCLAFAWQVGLGLQVHSPLPKLPLFLDVGAAYQGSPNSDIQNADLNRDVLLTAGVGVRF